MEHTMTTKGTGSHGFRGAKLLVYAAVILLVAEFIGSFTFSVGPGKVVLLPMIWALLMGGALGLLSERWKSGLRLDIRPQLLAAAVLQPAPLLFVSKLGLMVGSALPKLAASGWALAFQELGHFVGPFSSGYRLHCFSALNAKPLARRFRLAANRALPSSAKSTEWTLPKGGAFLPST